jgi:hypothetical protein
MTNRAVSLTPLKPRPATGLTKASRATTQPRQDGEVTGTPPTPAVIETVPTGGGEGKQPMVGSGSSPVSTVPSSTKITPVKVPTISTNPEKPATSTVIDEVFVIPATPPSRRDPTEVAKRQTPKTSARSSLTSTRLESSGTVKQTFCLPVELVDRAKQAQRISNLNGGGHPTLQALVIAGVDAEVDLIKKPTGAGNVVRNSATDYEGAFRKKRTFTFPTDLLERARSAQRISNLDGGGYSTLLALVVGGIEAEVVRIEAASGAPIVTAVAPYRAGRPTA